MADRRRRADAGAGRRRRHVGRNSYNLVAEIGLGWSLDDAENDWLTLHALSRFNLTRIPASFAQHVVRLTVASGAGPYSITPGSTS